MYASGIQIQKNSRMTVMKNQPTYKAHNRPGITFSEFIEEYAKKMEFLWKRHESLPKKSWPDKKAS